MTAYRKALRDAVVLTAIVAMVFSIWPAIDIYVSGLFFSDTQGFWIAQNPAVRHLRELVWVLILIVFAIALIALLFTKVFGSTNPALNKVWEVIVLTYLLGPALLVDAILKSHWGRARPSTITEFGGPLDFSPAFVISNQCPSNCSFVSGEGSGATAMLIAILLVTRNQVPGRYTKYVTYAGVVFATLGLALRVLMGRHFLSDTVLAMLFVTLIALGLLQLKRYRTIRLF